MTRYIPQWRQIELALPRACVTPGRARQCDRARGEAAAVLDRVRQVEKIAFKFGAQAGVGQRRNQLVAMKTGIQPEETNVRIRIDGAHAFRDARAQAQRRVHRCGDGDQRRVLHTLGIEIIHGDIDDSRRQTGAVENARRCQHTQRFVAELVTRDQYDVAHIHGLHWETLHGSIILCPRAYARGF